LTLIVLILDVMLIYFKVDNNNNNPVRTPEETKNMEQNSTEKAGHQSGWVRDPVNDESWFEGSVQVRAYKWEGF